MGAHCDFYHSVDELSIIFRSFTKLNINILHGIFLSRVIEKIQNVSVKIEVDEYKGIRRWWTGFCFCAQFDGMGCWVSLRCLQVTLTIPEPD